MKELKFVDVGEGITEGHVQKWSVKDGDDVKEDQTIVLVETDKAVVNVPSPISGKIKINVPDNTTVHVGDILAYIGDPTELANIPQKTQAQNPEAPAAQPPPMQQSPAAQPMQTAEAQAEPQQPMQTPSGQHEVITTPFVRKLARDNNIDITKVTGTGPGGRILENDVKSFIGKAPQQQKPTPKFSEMLEEQHADQIERVPMSQTRKAIAKNMEISATIPRAAHMEIIDASLLYSITKKEKENALKLGVKLTFLPFIIKATVEALKENPRMNSSYDPDRQELILKKYYNIGLAAEASDGLKVVVIKNADKKSILNLAKEIQELHKKINDNTIMLEEMRDSTFTITNIGSLGGGYLSVPMINPHEAAILGVHLIRDEPVVKDDMVKIGKILPLSLAFDHRIVDGADAVLFVNAIKKYLEDPEFLEML